MNKDRIVAAVNDSARKTVFRGAAAIVPLKFGKDKKPATLATLILKRLNRHDLQFLSLWQESGYSEDIHLLCEKTGLPMARVEWFCRKLDAFKKEDQRIKSLCAIPTPDFVAAKNVEGFYTDSFSEGQRDHLKELAKITGAYKQQAPSTQINVFNLPELPPEQAAKVKEVFDTIALEEPHVAA